MNTTQPYSIECPYCGETVEIIIDGSIPSQNYIEDCSVCCQPMTLVVTVDNEETVNVSAYQENDVS